MELLRVWTPQGAPDGIGGAIKRMANRLVAEGQIFTCFKFYLTCLKRISSIKLFLVTVKDREKIDAILNHIHIPPCICTIRVHQVL